MHWPTDKIIIICGATASGKSALALAAAAQTNGVIINADSVQVATSAT
jgi:tRNA dimethylallyltransferase